MQSIRSIKRTFAQNPAHSKLCLPLANADFCVLASSFELCVLILFCHQENCRCRPLRTHHFFLHTSTQASTPIEYKPAVPSAVTSIPTLSHKHTHTHTAFAAATADATISTPLNPLKTTIVANSSVYSGSVEDHLPRWPDLTTGGVVRAGDYMSTAVFSMTGNSEKN